MQCPKCMTQMKERKGVHGKFMFCPNQAECGQKTISEASYPDPQGKVVDYLEYDNTGSELMLTANLMEQSMGPLFSEESEPFVNDLGDEVDYDGSLVEHWRPY